MKTVIRLSVPKLECQCCGGYHRVPCPMIRAGSRHTRLLETDILRLSLENTNAAVAEELMTSPYTVTSTIRTAVDRGLGELDLSDTVEIYVDEVQFGHGQDYVTVVSNQDHEVVFICHDHTADAIRQAAEWIELNGGDRMKVRFACADMS